MLIEECIHTVIDFLHCLSAQFLNQFPPVLVADGLELLLLLLIQERRKFGVDFVADLLQLLQLSRA